MEEFDYDEVLTDVPYGAEYGKLENGLRYYIRVNSKPKMRAALALAVKVSSILEEDGEWGVAHIHLAFSATKRYANHDIVNFLESIGAEFGACQNAVTSFDETTFEYQPMIWKRKEVIMEEYRVKRNANVRMQEVGWRDA